MNKNYPFNELKQALDSSQKVMLVLPKNPHFDQVAAALSLSLSLEQIGRAVNIVCPTPMTVEFNHLVGVDKISPKIQGTDLVVSFDYSPDFVERVSYNDDGGRPNVVIQAKPGSPVLTESLASFSYAGAGADLVITLGLREQAQLNFSSLDFSNSFLINLDNNQNNSQFGSLNLVDPQVSSLSELVLGLAAGLGFPLETDTAQNLLDGIWAATNGLTGSGVDADTYEAVSICLRAGARKPGPAFSPKPVFNPKTKFEPQEEKPSFKNQPQPESKPKSDQKLPEKPSQTPTSKPPADWFEPKIFKGTNIS